MSGPELSARHFCHSVFDVESGQPLDDLRFPIEADAHVFHRGSLRARDGLSLRHDLTNVGCYADRLGLEYYMKICSMWTEHVGQDAFQYQSDSEAGIKAGWKCELDASLSPIDAGSDQKHVLLPLATFQPPLADFLVKVALAFEGLVNANQNIIRLAGGIQKSPLINVLWKRESAIRKEAFLQNWKKYVGKLHIHDRVPELEGVDSGNSDSISSEAAELSSNVQTTTFLVEIVLPPDTAVLSPFGEEIFAAFGIRCNTPDTGIPMMYVAKAQRHITEEYGLGSLMVQPRASQQQ